MLHIYTHNNAITINLLFYLASCVDVINLANSYLKVQINVIYYYVIIHNPLSIHFFSEVQS